MRLLAPFLAFAAGLGAAVAVTLGAADRPATGFHRAAVAYHRALEAGDEDGAVAHAGATGPTARDAQRRRIPDWQGRFWMIRSQVLEQGGRVGRLVVVRSIGDGRGLEEEEVWDLGDGGRWRLRSASIRDR